MATTRSSPSDQGSSQALTTFVQADPSTFRALVQKLTGAGNNPTHKLPVTTPARSNPKPVSAEMGPRRSSAFKLQERRQNMRKLEIMLGPPLPYHHGCRNVKGEMLLVSPVSPLDHLFPFNSPKTPPSPCLSSVTLEEEEEERAIAEKGFYLRPSPLNTPRSAEPELLTLFPLHSPTQDSS